MAGAVVHAASVKTGRSERFGAVKGLQKYAVSNTKGEFFIAHSESTEEIGVQLRAPGLAPKRVLIPTGGTVHEVVLDPGATLNGRLVQEGGGLGGYVIGLCQVSRRAGVFLGEFTIATQEDGSFVFNNIPKGQDYILYGKMNSLQSKGATEIRQLRVDRTVIDVGELICDTGSQLQGRVVTTDGSKLPGNTRMLVSADQAWDSQSCIVDAKGNFSFRGIPTGLYGVSLRLPGYRPSARNASRTPTSPGSFQGRIDRDITGLVLEFEPGQIEWPEFSAELARLERDLAQAPLRGIEEKPDKK